MEGMKAPEGLLGEKGTVVGPLKDNGLARLIFTCFQLLSLGIHSAPGASEKQINSWQKGREGKGDRVHVEWSMGELSLG